MCLNKLNVTWTSNHYIELHSKLVCSLNYYLLCSPLHLTSVECWCQSHSSWCHVEVLHAPTVFSQFLKQSTHDNNNLKHILSYSHTNLYLMSCNKRHFLIDILQRDTSYAKTSIQLRDISLGPNSLFLYTSICTVISRTMTTSRYQIFDDAKQCTFGDSYAIVSSKQYAIVHIP